MSEQAVDGKKGGPFGAVIVREGKIIGSSGNCVFKDTDPTAHAEVMAIKDACKNMQSVDLSGCEIYSSAEPCPMCTAAIYWANLKTVYYSNTEKDALEYGFVDKEILAELKKPSDKRKIKSTRISNPAAIKVFDKALKTHL
ncbi:MAG: nucleoside deaminase [Gloeobacteraceae cyanobacterium ES-bin-316]|nr:nucleoside deaminase [Ferruginibacter sp.]